jgi:diadenosine tetraphosphate (Ap4A) HIT family hydrolase
MTFSLDAKLEADTHAVGELPLCSVRLMDDRRFPWLILVPRKANVVELIDLSPAERGIAMEEIALASTALTTVFNPDKLNVAALGNVVRQLHVHVIARFVSDECFPRPIFGQGEAVPYPPHMAGSLIDRLRKALKLES